MTSLASSLLPACEMREDLEGAIVAELERQQDREVDKLNDTGVNSRFSALQWMEVA